MSQLFESIESERSIVEPVRSGTVSENLEILLRQVNAVLLGKEREVRLAAACLLARGHLLIDGLPGVGKTTLAQSLAVSLGLDFRRVQFTSDLLPSDVLGVSVYDRRAESFRFHPGPVFTQVLLADEINRAPPRTQSALLEAMEERQVSVEGESKVLPKPFFVIASQNPQQQIGTFPLPESQLDRFLLRVELTHPDPHAERALFESGGRRRNLHKLTAVMGRATLEDAQAAADAIYVAPPIYDYLQAILAETRQSGRFVTGLSSRAGLGLLAASRAWALLLGRSEVFPEDLQAVLPALVEHRLQLLSGVVGTDTGGIGRGLIEALPVP